ncbi:uncharacterized protein LOC120836032 [Ixodes scapularis]|uniref:uncharacterized protein LOC120836032 n=1 Tax=Ixodes scapularis TaxID=6945 RepID=UPI001A9D9603|nr:uncharacterized protein LOC120836032 [Ixodes scapularis]
MESQCAVPKSKKDLKAARLAYNDKLICAVQKRPILWNFTLGDYKDHRKKLSIWDDVLEEVGEEPEGNTPQFRWKSLRDTFTKKFKKWKVGAPSGSGADGAKEVRWCYFKMMFFLKDFVDVPSTTSSMVQGCTKTQESAEAVLMEIYSEPKDPLEHGDAPDILSSDSSCSLSSEAASPKAPPKASTSTAPKKQCAVKSNRKKSRVDVELDKVDEQLDQVEEVDECALFGQIMAHKMRLCPQRLRTDFQIGVLGAAKTFEEEQ